ncbi:scavenger receptor cysteine-rich domain-containing group B protein-like isoform X2 [Callorhinchus milii]|uniref:scavenger receptor cysteine-rich domain-containing group B protein-like isoform X2 n=1 Tax=Callorhinchus milii TaxID=7868 RepID=UPI001C3F870A|nr:scavenger receptor cysteine-rich domain-containing group B protein-like isoform X2 [Callorhinchus milii]
MELSFLILVIFLERKIVESAEEVRLVNGSRCAGRVEVYYGGKWGRVQGSRIHRYDLTWDMKEAAVVCKELGCGYALSAPGGAHFGKGRGHITMHDVWCRGTESTLSECTRKTSGHYYWRPDPYDANVICSGK